MILNLTQHEPTPEQRSAGVVDLPPAERAELAKLLNFEDLPSSQTIETRADAISMLAREYFLASQASPSDETQAMIGGAPFLMPRLEQVLTYRGIQPIYAFSRREVVEQHLPDGSVRKSAIFRHVGFVGSAVYWR